MSQLFDSLRHRRKSTPAPASGARRTAHGDAVLATLGYAPARRSSRVGAVLVPLAVIAGMAVTGYAGWRAYSGGGAVTPATRTASPSPRRANRPATPAPAASSPKPAPAPPAVEPAPVEPRRRPATPPPASAPVTAVERAPRPAAARATPPPSPAASPPPPSPPAPVAGNTFELALYYHRSGDFANALLQYRALLEANELNAQAHNNLGLLYQEKNLLDESARELQRAVIIEPGYARGHNNYGVTLLRQGRLDAAASEFRTVLALEPRNVDAMVNLALVEKSAGEVERAKQSLLHALSAAPRHAAAHYNLAVLYDGTGELSRAMEHYRAFLDNTGAEYADRAPAVRARLAALAK